MAKDAAAIPAGAVDLSQVSGAPDADPVIPTVMAVTNRYLVHGVNLTPVAEDGSRDLALHSRGGTLIEVSLGPDVLQHIKAVLNDEVAPQDEAAESEAEGGG